MNTTRRSVNESATSNPNEVLVVFNTDLPENPILNFLLRDAAVMKTALIANPVGSPGRAAAEATAYDAAELSMRSIPIGEGLVFTDRT